MEKYEVFDPYEEELKDLITKFQQNKHSIIVLKGLRKSCNELQEKIHSVKISNNLLSYLTVLSFSVSYLSTEIFKQILLIERKLN